MNSIENLFNSLGREKTKLLAEQEKARKGFEVKYQKELKEELNQSLQQSYDLMESISQEKKYSPEITEKAQKVRETIFKKQGQIKSGFEGVYESLDAQVKECLDQEIKRQNSPKIPIYLFKKAGWVYILTPTKKENSTIGQDLANWINGITGLKKICLGGNYLKDNKSNQILEQQEKNEMEWDQEIKTIEGFNLYGMQCENYLTSSFKENILARLQNPSLIPKAITNSKLKLEVIELPYEILENFEKTIKSGVGRPSDFNTSNPRERLEELKINCEREGEQWNWKYLSTNLVYFNTNVSNFI